MLADLGFFLDEFGSTRAVRAKLQQQERDIARLGNRVQQCLAIRAEHEISRDEPEKDATGGEIVENNATVTEEEDVAQTMVDLDFFLKTYKSTRAVREKLESQRQRIENLHRTLQSLEKQRWRLQTVNNTDDASMENVGTVAVSAQNYRSESEKDTEAQPVDLVDIVGVGGDNDNAAEGDSVVALSQLNGEDSVEVQRYSASSDGDNQVEPIEDAAIEAQKEQGNEFGARSVVDKCCVSVEADASARSRKKQTMCRYPSCVQRSQERGLCYAHGGFPRCKKDGCNQIALSRRLCSQHGGRMKCSTKDCRKYECNDGQGYCVEHTQEEAVVVKRAVQKTSKIQQPRNGAQGRSIQGLEKHGERRSDGDSYEEYVDAVSASKSTGESGGGFDDPDGGDAAKEDAVVALPERNDEKCAEERQSTASSDGDVQEKRVGAAVEAREGLDGKQEGNECGDQVKPGSLSTVEKCETTVGSVIGCTDPHEEAKSQQLEVTRSPLVPTDEPRDANTKPKARRKRKSAPRLKPTMCRYPGCVEWSQWCGLCYAHGSYGESEIGGCNRRAPLIRLAERSASKMTVENIQATVVKLAVQNMLKIQQQTIENLRRSIQGLETQRQRQNGSEDCLETPAASGKAGNNSSRDEKHTESQRVNKVNTSGTHGNVDDTGTGDAAKNNPVVALQEHTNQASVEELHCPASSDDGDVQVKNVEVAAMEAQKHLDGELQDSLCSDQGGPGASAVGNKCESKVGVASDSDSSEKQQQKISRGPSVPTEQPGNESAEANVLNRKPAQRRTRTLCRYPGCVQWAHGRGLCYAHGGYRECRIVGCSQRALTQRLCSQHHVRMKCAISDCGKYAVPGGQRHCLRHAREAGVMVRSSSTKCSVDGCETFARGHGHGYCCKHARDHGFPVKSGWICNIDGCGKFAKLTANGHRYCCKHARENGIVVVNAKKCRVDGCEAFARGRAAGYCCKHARKHGIFVSPGKKCSVDGCEKFAHAKGYCRRHARENGIVVRDDKPCRFEDCKSLAAGSGRGYCRRHARENGIVVVGNGKRCSLADCEKFAVAHGQGYCQRHARENGIVLAGNGKKCSTDGCEKIAQIQGFCRRHARENGVAVSYGKRCSVDNCNAFAVGKGRGFCRRHAWENGIVVVINGKRCRIDGCVKFAVARGQGYCRRHARENVIDFTVNQCSVEDCENLAVVRGCCRKHATERGIVTRCEFERCQNLHKGQGYCEDHQSHEAKLAEDRGRQLEACKTTSPLPAPSSERVDTSSSQPGPNTKIIRRRGPHVTCKAVGCMKWVNRNRDPSEFCVKHRQTSTSQEPATVPVIQNATTCKAPKDGRGLCQEPECSKFAKNDGPKKGYCFRHGGGVTCSQPGCTKQRQRLGLCASHGGYYECKVGECKKRAILSGCCRVHYQ